MKQVVVIVPIYKQSLSDFEQVSLTQLVYILSRWNIVFVLPERLHGWEPIAGYQCKYIADQYFIDVASYSQLLMTDYFYALFADYEYILIYQLDAFVFSDRLQEFCEMGYDYIGAPWPFYLGAPTGYHARIGNGGFSLRRIAAVRQILQKKEMIFAEVPQFRDWFCNVEDAFFGYCGAKAEIDFTVPDVQIALRFSIEHEIGKLLSVEKQDMPFGCHGWYKLNYVVWKPIIEDYGYRLPKCAEANTTSRELCLNYMAHYLCQRKLRAGEGILVKSFFRELLPVEVGQVYTFWGGGMVGTILFDLMHSIGLSPAIVYDRSGNVVDFPCKVSLPPQRAALQKHDSVIIVTTTKYYTEIELLLLEAGLIKNRDFISGVILLRRLAAKLYPSFKKIFWE